MQIDEMGSDYICNIENNVEICINKNSKNPIIDSRNYFEIKTDHLDYNSDAEIGNTCKKAGVDCVSQSVFNASKVIFVFFLSVIAVTFFHELAHFMVFAISGESTSGFTLDLQGGATNIDLPSPNSHSIWWWYAALLLPMLIVNGGIILLNFFVKYEENEFNVLESDENVYNKRLARIFLRACGYTSAMAILASLFFYPVIEFQSDFLFLRSDFSLAWNISTSIAQGMTLQLLCIFTAIVCATISLLFVFIYGKKRN